MGGRFARSLVITACAFLMLSISPAFALTPKEAGDICWNDAAGYSERMNACNIVLAYDELPARFKYMFHYVRGHLFSGKGYWKKAIADYTATLHIKPDFYHAYNDRGIAWSNLRESGKAIEDYSRAIEFEPLGPKLYNNRAHSWRALDEFDNAISDFSKVIELDETFPEIFVVRGQTYELAGKRELSRSDFRKALKLNPTDTSALVSLGNSYARENELNEAIEHFTKALAIDPGDKYALRSRSQAFLSRLQFEGARSDLLNLRKTDFFDSYMALMLFIAEERTGDSGIPHLENTISRSNDRNWPYPVIQYYLDQLNEDDVLQGIQSESPQARLDYEAEAYTYIAQKRLIEGDQSGATDMFRKTIALGRTKLAEHQLAVKELERLESK